KPTDDRGIPVTGNRDRKALLCVAYGSRAQKFRPLLDKLRLCRWRQQQSPHQCENSQPTKDSVPDFDHSFPPHFDLIYVPDFLDTGFKCRRSLCRRLQFPRHSRESRWRWTQDRPFCRLEQRKTRRELLPSSERESEVSATSTALELTGSKQSGSIPASQ